MDKDTIKDFYGKNVIIDLESKSITGNIIECNDVNVKIETDFGLLEISNEKIKDINRTFKFPDLNVYVCKNEVIGCKGMRFLSTHEQFDWKCNYFKKYNCQVKRICNFNELPINIKISFLNGLHSDPPIIEDDNKKI